ncbi:MAG: hypothetical protein ACI4DW_03535 [Lachnospiraceae bacterium]
MYTYKIWQWFLFFFIYCFLGWCWETAYVSIRKRQFVNRGFMKGPFLPIYGFGALAILVAVIPVKSFPILVYLAGLISATLLELVTGIIMERLFRVRYWDYSQQKFNYKGYICLSSSIAWGAFSLAMIYGFHNPIERRVLSIPDNWGMCITLCLTTVTASDFAVSFKTAIELRDLLSAMDNIKEEISRLQRRAEILETILSDDMEKKSQEWHEKYSQQLNTLREDLKAGKDAFKAGKEISLEELRQLKQSQQQRMLTLKTRLREATDSRRSVSIHRLLRRNPSAVSRRYANSFHELKEQMLETLKEKIDKK